MSSNKRRIDAAVSAYRKELAQLVAETRDLDARVLNRAVAEGVRMAKENTPVRTGVLRRSWYQTPAIKGANVTKKEFGNTADYSAYVNYGHRVVRGGVTVGFARGIFVMERAAGLIEKIIPELFKKELEAVKKAHE